jgi:hypothetical protein
MISSVGNARGTITFPGPTIITSPKNNDSIYPDQALIVTWTGNSNYYYVEFYFSDMNYNGLYIDTICVDKTIEITPIQMTGFSGLRSMSIDITGCNGAELTAGTFGNMQGDGAGFLNAINGSDWKSRTVNLRFYGSTGSIENGNATRLPVDHLSIEKKEQHLARVQRLLQKTMEHK